MIVDNLPNENDVCLLCGSRLTARKICPNGCSIPVITNNIDEDYE